MALTFHTNLVNVATSYLKVLSIPVTATSMKRSLEENPFYPSLYALSNTFDRFQIPHVALHVEKESINSYPPLYCLAEKPIHR